MKLIFKFFILAFVVFTFSESRSQETKTPLTGFKPLLGEWVGEGDGLPGQGKGSFTFTPDLSGKIIVRKNHSEYPNRDGSTFVHDDLMVVYPDSSGTSAKAIYFDNEGHTINYTASFLGHSIVFLSDAIVNAPRFRLTYSIPSEKVLMIRFEVAAPPASTEFKTYLEGRCLKKGL